MLPTMPLGQTGSRFAPIGMLRSATALVRTPGGLHARKGGPRRNRACAVHGSAETIRERPNVDPAQSFELCNRVRAEPKRPGNDMRREKGWREREKVHARILAARRRFSAQQALHPSLTFLPICPERLPRAHEHLLDFPAALLWSPH